MNLQEYPDRDMMMIEIASEISSDLKTALQTNGTASLSVPGGTTPGPIFDMLSAADLDWANISVMLNDERWVDESSDRSNTRLLRERLLVGRAASARLVPLYKDAPTPEAALPELMDGVRAALPLSVLLLGMGEDMHTASLFPGADRLEDALDAQAPPLLPMRADGAGEPRITLTAPALNSAFTKHIVITGTAKKDALLAARKLDPKTAPVTAIWLNAKIHWAE